MDTTSNSLLATKRKLHHFNNELNTINITTETKHATQEDKAFLQPEFRRDEFK